MAKSAKPAPKKETASAEATKSGGVPPLVWIILIIIVGVVAYFLGQGKG